MVDNKNSQTHIAAVRHRIARQWPGKMDNDCSWTCGLWPILHFNIYAVNYRLP